VFARSELLEKIGFTVEALDSKACHRLGFDGEEGVLVTEVERNGPAWRAGLHPCPIIASPLKILMNLWRCFPALTVTVCCSLSPTCAGRTLLWCPWNSEMTLRKASLRARPFFIFQPMKRIGITIGDINGIGPEVALKAVGKSRWPADVRFVFIGSESIFREQAAAMQIPVSRKIEFVEVEQAAPPAHPGKVRVDASRLAETSIRMAVEDCLSGELDAMVTAPICKEGFNKAGINVPGHTEFLAELTHTTTFGMMLMGGGLRVMLVTRHLPISAVPAALTKKNIREAIELTGQALELFGIKDGKIGVCGLNPHAGDGGVIGREEIELINPAIRAVRKAGFNVSDAVPADTIFYEALRGDYAAVVAMYHDQGLGPLKMIGFDEGINVTLGLPIIRTSPDHGTAFGIAGKNQASPKSMKNAIALAIEMAGKPNPWK